VAALAARMNLHEAQTVLCTDAVDASRDQAPTVGRAPHCARARRRAVVKCGSVCRADLAALAEFSRLTRDGVTEVGTSALSGSISCGPAASLASCPFLRLRVQFARSSRLGTAPAPAASARGSRVYVQRRCCVRHRSTFFSFRSRSALARPESAANVSRTRRNHAAFRLTDEARAGPYSAEGVTDRCNTATRWPIRTGPLWVAWSGHPDVGPA
jgi:hypothetical protein